MGLADTIVKTDGIVLRIYHRLRGSASHVLMATG